MAALGVGAQFGVLLPYSRTHESANEIGKQYARLFEMRSHALAVVIL